MVPRIAAIIPAAAIKFPLLAVAGLESIFKPMMKVIEAIK